jgi:nucleoid DNA-binding protein
MPCKPRTVCLKTDYFIHAINQQSGIPVHTVRTVLCALTSCMTEEIKKGNSVGLEHLGMIQFRLRKGRRCSYTNEFTPDRIYLHFKTAAVLLPVVQGLNPEELVPTTQQRRRNLLSPKQYAAYKVLSDRRTKAKDSPSHGDGAWEPGMRAHSPGDEQSNPQAVPPG